MKLSQLASLLGTTLTGIDSEFISISKDTRTLKAGELYIAICGEHLDGHDFITQAEQAGAVGALISQPVITSLPTLHVADTVKALGQWAAHHRQHIKIPLLAITGSCGKTTTRNMLASILRQQGQVLVSTSNYNNEIGLPLTYCA